MISYTLYCKSQEHRFSVWFQSYADSKKQLKDKLLECPYCGSHNICRGIQTTSFNTNTSKKSNKQESKQFVADNFDMLKKFSKVRQHLENVVDKAEDVGDQLMTEMDAMINDEKPVRHIKGKIKSDDIESFIDKASSPDVKERFLILPISQKKNNYQ